MIQFFIFLIIYTVRTYYNEEYKYKKFSDLLNMKNKK